MSHTVLFIDDDDLVLRAVSSRFSNTEFAFYTASTNHEAFELLQSTKIETVVADYYLGEDTSLKLIHHIRENYDHIRVFIISADPSAIPNSDTYDGIMLKPVTPETLRKQLSL